MAEQIPQTIGLEEQIDRFFIQQLETLCRFYTQQQGQPDPIDIRVIYNKMDDIKYPFIGVLTNLGVMQPIAIGDLFYESTNAADFRHTINDVRTNILIQCEEIRELQRLRSFLEVNLLWGVDPMRNQPWSTIFRDDGSIVITGFECTDYERVGFESVVQRTQNAQGNERMRRADIETLWEVQLGVVSLVQCAVEINVSDPARGIIQGLNLIVSPR